MEKTVGVDRIGIYVPDEVLPITRLAEARGLPAEKLVEGLGLRAMAIAPPWEDAVTLAANAASRALRAWRSVPALDPEEIGLCIVATESAVDHAKPVSIFVHELLGLPSACRTYEVKHACFGGTAALMSAAEWIVSGAARGRKALVIASDVARYRIGSAGEPTQGAGAAALVISQDPALLRLDFGRSGCFAANVYDFWRPLDSSQALVDGKFSLECYLEALGSAYEEYRRIAGEGESTSDVSVLTDAFAAVLYHTPFPKMAWKAHRALLEREWSAMPARASRSIQEIDAGVLEAYRRQVEPSLWAVRQVGNTYTASLYICLAALLEREASRLAGKRIGLFSYGSGACAEFFSGVIAPQAPICASSIGLESMLAHRREVGIAEYERWYSHHELRGVEEPEAPGPGFEGPHYHAGVVDAQRRYARIGADRRSIARGAAA